MPQTSDPSPKTLPRQELNPLLNPLLAENMTRWAEVYFNNPPERRERAVLDLLHELEAQQALREAATVAPRATFHNTPLAGISAAADNSSTPRTAEDDLLRCERCGRDNPVTHKFCGMCGEMLHPKRLAARQTADALEHSDLAYQDDNRKKEAMAEARTEAELESVPISESYEERPEPPLRGIGELSLFQSAPRKYENYDDEDATNETSHSHSYRFYIGGLLAIVLLALGYTAWRASHNSQTSAESSPVPPVAAQEAPAATQPATIQASNATEPNPAAAVAAKPAPPSQGSPIPAKPLPTAGKTDPGVSVAEAGSRAPNKSSTGGGNEELAQAESYLDGANGRPRDSAAAAHWLWESIAKHNGRATLILADLYLKGDGVSKNCDQARVLLDSAARKGVAGAGERLRNLQAFGCQ